MAQIIRGTTPTISFQYSDITVSDITKAILSLKQSGQTVIERDLTTATISEDSISWELTQAETLTLNASRNVSIVCDWLLSSGVRGRSNILSADVGEAGKDEVI